MAGLPGSPGIGDQEEGRPHHPELGLGHSLVQGSQLAQRRLWPGPLDLGVQGHLTGGLPTQVCGGGPSELLSGGLGAGEPLT